MELKPGTQLASTACATQVVVVKPPEGEVEITCGGHAMVPAAEAGEPTEALASGFDGGTQMGKRYEAPEVGLELLCTRPGEGSLAVDGQVLSTKEAKAVPSSD